MEEDGSMNIVGKRIIFYLCLVSVSLMLFGGIYGFSMLDPGNIAYIYNNFDTEQHYFGWVSYRDAAWQFPLGLHDRLIYPDDTSVIFTDSIPILAFFFKLLSPVLPETFQFFGLWALLSMFLTGMFSAWILRDHCNNEVEVFLSATLMMIVPSMMIRAFVHEALGGQWLVMMALWIFYHVRWECLHRDDGVSMAFLVIPSGLLGFFVGGVHMYFIPICGIILAGCAMYLILSKRMWSGAAVLIVSYILSALLSIWIWGGFSTDLPMGNVDYTMGNPANLNALFNPLGYSMFFDALPLNSGGQDDGYAYLGLGVWIVVITAVCMIIREDSKKRDFAFAVSAILMIIADLWFSTYPVITFGKKLIFEYRLPDFLVHIMAIFRCNGRGIWVLSYFVSISSLIYLCRRSEGFGKKALIPVLLVLCITLQIVDISPLMRYKYEYCSNPRVIEEPLLSAKELRDLVSTGRYEHVFVDESLKWAEAPVAFAMENHLTTSRFYLARQNEESNARRNEEEKRDPSDDTIYFFPKSESGQADKLGLKMVYSDGYFYAGVTD